MLGFDYIQIKSFKNGVKDKYKYNLKHGLTKTKFNKKD